MATPPRLPCHDYRSDGAYFITLCTLQRRRCLAEFVEGSLRESRIGAIVRTAWQDLPRHHPGVSVDSFVIMPDHIHGILFLSAETGMGEAGVAPTPRGPRSGSLGAIVGSFKAATVRVAHGRGALRGPLWQRGYYDRVVRNPQELAALRRYIEENPQRGILRDRSG